MRAVPQDVAIDPAQVNLEFLLLTLGPPHLPGVGVAAGHDQGAFAQPQIALSQRNAAIPGGLDQKNSGLVIQPGIGGIGDRLLLHLSLIHI